MDRFAFTVLPTISKIRIWTIFNNHHIKCPIRTFFLAVANIFELDNPTQSLPFNWDRVGNTELPLPLKYHSSFS